MKNEKKERYPSDLSDKEWKIIKPFVEQGKNGRPREVDTREVINAIFYITKTGCQWRYLPKDFPDWHTVRRYFDNWKIDGTWEKINDSLRRKLRKKIDRNEEPSAAIIDSQSVKATEMSGNIATFDGGKKN
jgi:putative transposase